MKILQYNVELKPRSRGYHIITSDVEYQCPGLRNVKAGLAHIFIMHTSAGLSINENADPSVRDDFETFFNRLVPEDTNLFRHTMEGPDDMTSHIKSSLTGSSVCVPVSNGKFALGTWQGIYLCEFRNHGGSRNLTVTIIGDEMNSFRRKDT